MKNINWNEVEEASEFKKVAPGGYVCGITAVEDVADKEYLKIEYDIAEGEFKNYYRELYQSKSFWGGSFFKSYKETALSFFKSFITAVQNSNKGYIFNNDESTLKRKLLGLVLGEEEYQANDGTIKTRLYVAQIHSVDKIRKGDYKVPELKKLDNINTNKPTYNNAPSSSGGFEPVDIDNDLPF